jgi:hypothetical protein
MRFVMKNMPSNTGERTNIVLDPKLVARVKRLDGHGA